MKNIVLCSDGTANKGGRSRSTNVWRLFRAIDRYNESVKQITFYDDGVGTDDLKWLKILGGAFGWGLSRNICQLYSFLVMNYEHNDKIFLFGFSRGAFTVRALAGMICKCGVLDKLQYIERKDRNKLVKQLLLAYREDGTKNLERLKAEEVELHDVEIEFIGVWDTVDAVGIPMDRPRQWLDGSYKALTGRRLYGFHDRNLSLKVKHGVQALAIDDERKTFHPNIWNARDNVEQVWFAGAHSNVGGGYPKDAMSLVTLSWMVEKAEACGLRIMDKDRQKSQQEADAYGKLYNSRSGAASYYRYAIREMGNEPVVHISVFDRIKNGTQQYAPVIIPRSAKVAYSAHSPYDQKFSDDVPKLDQSTLDVLRKLAGQRKSLYYAFLIFNFVVAGFVLWALLNPKTTSATVSGQVGEGLWGAISVRLQQFVTLLVPSFLKRAVQVMWEHPIWAAAFATVFVVLRRISAIAKRRMKEIAFLGWQRACGTKF